MGYTTDFSGAFALNKPLSHEHAAYLRQFAQTRRQQRDARRTAERPDPIREAVGLPAGDEGAYFVGETGFAGQDSGPDVLDGNRPPTGQPGLWCQWVPNDDSTAIEWDQGEKFYEYVPWVEYLIAHFLAPWGYVLDGEVLWQGEEPDDRGMIRVVNNNVSTLQARTVYEEHPADYQAQPEPTDAQRAEAMAERAEALGDDAKVGL